MIHECLKKKWRVASCLLSMSLGIQKPCCQDASYTVCVPE
jgi:hypothetical protein